MDYQSDFKNNYISTVFKIAKTNWLKISTAYFMVMVISSGFIALILGSFFSNFMSYPFFQHSNIPLLNRNIFSSIFHFIFLLGIVAVISFFLSSWYYNFSFIVTEFKIKNNDSGFGEIFKRSFNSGIFKIMLITLLHVIFTYLVLQVGFLSTLESKWPIIIASLSVIYFIYRSVLILPASLVGKKPLLESFSFSFKHITLLRVIKLFVGSIVMIIILLIIQGIIFGAIFLFSKASVSGIGFKIALWLIQMMTLMFVSGFTTSFVISAITGLYFKYEEKNEDDEDIENDDLPDEHKINLFA